MAFTSAEKAPIIQTYHRSKTDTGSPEVQIALLTSRINYLTEHLKAHKHDFHTRYGLTNLVSKRRRLLRYLKAKHPQVHRDLVEKLEIRG